jgi:hypothetical protein
LQTLHSSSLLSSPSSISANKDGFLWIVSLYGGLGFWLSGLFDLHTMHLNSMHNLLYTTVLESFYNWVGCTFLVGDNHVFRHLERLTALT